MPNTYTQIYLQTVFAVKYRHGLIRQEWRENLYRYMTGINPKQSVSELMQNLKGDSSLWINDEKLTMGKFEWQSGYGAFSYGHSQIDSVVKYIQNQEEHHRKRTFLEE